MSSTPPPGFDDDDDNGAPPGFVDEQTVQSILQLAEQESTTTTTKQPQHAPPRHGKKEKVPVEFLRKILRDQGDLKEKKYRQERRLYLGMMQYAPLAIAKLFETMPMPWEEARYVDTVYHVGGALTIIEEVPTVAEPLYTAQWGSAWTTMRLRKVEMKEEGGMFGRVSFPLFDDNEPPIDFAEHILDREAEPTLRDDGLSPEDDAAIIDWFYDPDPRLVLPSAIRPRRGQWYFSIEIMEALGRIATPLLPEYRDPNFYYLWDLKSFYNAKAMHVAIPRAPKFEQLSLRGKWSGATSKRSLADPTVEEDEEDWTEFNDLRRVIYREDPRKPKLAMRTERQIAYPYLSSRSIVGVRPPPYHYPSSVVLQDIEEDPSVPAFVFHPSLHPLKQFEKSFDEWKDTVQAPRAACRKGDLDGALLSCHVASELRCHGFAEEEDDMLPELEELTELRLDVPLVPFLADVPLEAEHATTKAGLSMVFAPAPFDTFQGAMKRPMDIPLTEHWCQLPPDLVTKDARDKVARSYTQLLKTHVKQKLQREGGAGVLHSIVTASESSATAEGKAALAEEEEGAEGGKQHAKVRRLDKLGETKYFQKANMDWIEAGLQLVRQGHIMLTQMLNMKCLPYVHIDYNFHAKPTRTLTTKEIKKSRLGPSFHLLRELFGFTKHLVDVHVNFRLGQIDAHQLADAVHYLFTHVGKVTRLYSYKYRAMRPIKRSRDLKHMLYDHFNVGEVQRGPGMGFWAPAWRTWVFYLRGLTPLLQRYLANVVNRMFEGRKHKVQVKRITRQRIESDRDVNLKSAFRTELQEMLPENARPGIVKTMEQHLNESFRHWKSSRTWNAPAGMAQPLVNLVLKYTKLRAEEYIRYAHAQRAQIANGMTVDKQAFMKNLGRLTRLKLMEEQKRQHTIPQAAPEEISIYEMMANWLSDRGFKKISFPTASHPASLDLLKLSLNRLRQQHNIANRLTQDQREEQKRIEDAFDAPQECYTRIRESLAHQRRFKPVQTEHMDAFAHLYPIYNVHAQEKMVDSFLDYYLWYEAMEKQRLFPNWVKPADQEPIPVLVHKFAQGVNNSPDVWDVSHHESVVCLKMDLGESFYNQVNWNSPLFRQLLELIMDKTLVDYIVARHDVMMEFKDMAYHHQQGLIRGFMFAPFLAQFWGLVVDVLLLGSRRSLEIAGPPRKPNPFLSFARDPVHATTHPIRGYMRYHNVSYILLKFTEAEADEVRTRYLEGTKGVPEYAAQHRTVHGYKNFANWPRDCRMRLFLNDVNLARAVTWEFQGRIPGCVCESIPVDRCQVSVYSQDNPNLLFDMCGFSVRILPVSRTQEEILESENMWSLHNDVTREMTARAWVQVAPSDVVAIKNKIRRAILMIGNSTFQNIAAKWNALVTEIVPLYREAILGTDGLQEMFAWGEKRMQSRIMMALNSKMASRFPPVMFYAPTDMGGLGMLSVGHSLIPAKDTVFAKKTTSGVQHFLSGLTNTEDIPIPNVLQAYRSWDTEVSDDAKAKADFSKKLREAKLEGTRLSADDLEQILDKGIPRIRVFFNREQRLYKFEKGFRVRMEFHKYMFGKFLKNWWFNPMHDGNLGGGLDRYRQDMIIALGGVEAILEHSLFKGTGFPSWEGLDWNRASGFENSKKDANITKAMRGGLTMIPNRRFALWWSPTINRGDVYVGFESQLDLTGVFMCGKLETIKKSLIKIFANGMWPTIHRSISDSIAAKLTRDMSLLGFESVEKQHTHPNKSFTFNSSAADIVLYAPKHFLVTNEPSLLAEEARDVYQNRVTKKYWIDLQLRWGNFDSHNIAEYARKRFHEYSRDGRSMYPSPAGIVVAYDLSYNCCSAYGFWIPGLKSYLQKLLPAILSNDSNLISLRLKLRSEMQLYSSTPTESNLNTTNLAEIFSSDMRTWIVDDSATYVTSGQVTAEGSKRYRAENGAVVIFEPLTGVLRFSVVHKSVFVGQKRRTKLAREKAAEEIVTWLRSVPSSELPSKIIVTRSRFRPMLHGMLHDFANITVGSSDLNLAVPMIMRHSRLTDLRLNAVENKVFKFNVYDDWLNQFQPTTCFRLLNLILRGYHINLARTRETLEPDVYVEKKAGHFWPTYNRDEWDRVSVRLSEMILADYARRNNISPHQLTEEEKQAIIFGKKLANQEVMAEETQEIEAAAAAAEERQAAKEVAATVVSTVNKAGDLTRNRVKMIMDTANSTSTSDWRPRALADAILYRRAQQLDVIAERVTARHEQLIFPQQALFQLVQSCDVDVSVIVYLFGQPLPDTPNIKEIVCMMIPPQSGSLYDVKTPERIPHDHPVLVESNLQLLGILRVGGGVNVIHSKDLALHGRLVACNESLQPDGLCHAVLGTRDNSLTLQCYTITEEGVMWAMESHPRALAQEPQDILPNHTMPCRAAIGATLQGFFLVPSEGVWNCAFRGVTWRQHDSFQVQVTAQPQPFFALEHRLEHVRNFVRLDDDDGQTEIDMMEDDTMEV